MQRQKIENSYISVGENLNIAWEVFQNNWKIFSAFLLLFAIPFNLLNSLIQSNSIPLNSFYVTLFIIFLILNITSLLTTNIITEKTILDNPIQLVAAFQKSITKILWVLIFNLMAFLPIFIALFFFLIPGIFLLVKFIFINQAIILRNAGDAFNYSSKLVQGNWWKVFGHLLFFLLFVTCIFFAIAIPIIGIEIIVANSTSSIHFQIINVLNNAISALLSDFITIFFTIYLTTFFINLDCIKSGQIFQK
jgi:hypothetical protein